MRKSVRAIAVPKPRVLLACSGGKDSVALAWILSELRRLNLLTFSIAHIHHGQHQRADFAAESVQTVGELLGAPVIVHHLDSNAIDAHKGVGLEEAMRRERYRALAEIAKAQNADCIALAHHQTDQAETILLHLMRGSGMDGLAGMRAWDRRSIPWWEASEEQIDVAFWRPLLSEPGEVVAGVANSSGLPVVEDPTNIDPQYRRNAIRHLVLPVLENIAEGSTASIARSASVIADDAELLEQVTDRALGECLHGDSISRSSLLDLPPALQARVIRTWVLDQSQNAELSADRTQAIVDLAMRNRGGAVVEVGSGHRVLLRDGLLSID